MPAESALKRSLKLPAVTLYGVGAILGAGIYVLIGEIAGQAGYFAPLSFVLAAIIATFSAFSYAELSARFPRSAGEAVYIEEAFGWRNLTRLIGLLVIFTGIVSAATIATLLYVVVIYAALSVLPPGQLAASSAPLADVAAAQGYPSAWIGLISIIAVVNGAIVQLIMASRVIYGMASGHLLPEFLARVNAYTATPVQATVLCIVITLLLALMFPVASLAQATSIIVLSVFTLVNLALIRINSLEVTSETIHYPAFIPYIGAILCIGMLIIKAAYLIS